MTDSFQKKYRRFKRKCYLFLFLPCVIGTVAWHVAKEYMDLKFRQQAADRKREADKAGVADREKESQEKAARKRTASS